MLAGQVGEQLQQSTAATLFINKLLQASFLSPNLSSVSCTASSTIDGATVDMGGKIEKGPGLGPQDDKAYLFPLFGGDKLIFRPLCC